MKKFLQFMMLMALGTFAFNNANAQMADGSIAPNFTATDIDGVEHTLYDYLDDGYSVIIDFSATWCVPCWNYHITGTLEEVWANHGPAGMPGVNEDTTDDVMILFLEGDDDTTSDDLIGTGGNTTGDWTDGTMYPMIDDVEDLFYLYECTYYPTMYTICPSRVITETGQIGADAHYDHTTDNCAPATEGSDGALYSYTGETVSCGDVEVVVELANTGTMNLTSATILVTGGTDDLEYMWTGDLSTWQIEEVTVGTVSITSATDLTIEITSTDDNASNNSVNASIATATDATTQWFMDLTTDCWPGETGWEVKNSDGDVIASAAPGTYAENGTTYNETFNVGSLGCYSFTFIDTYGDGMFGSQWTGCDLDGNYSLHTAAGTISAYDGSYNVSEIAAGANASTVSVNELAGVNVVWTVYPNPTNDITNVSYSIDAASDVVFEVYNILGERIISEDLGTIAAGQYIQTFDLGAFEAGVYIVNLNANGNVSTQRVTVQ